jgi:hypothetical protein
VPPLHHARRERDSDREREGRGEIRGYEKRRKE